MSRPVGSINISSIDTVCVYTVNTACLGNAMYSRHKFFDHLQEVKLILTSEKAILQITTCITKGKTIQVKKNKSGGSCLYINGVPTGRYKIDPEETNEDQLVFYFEDKIEEKCNEVIKEEVV